MSLLPFSASFTKHDCARRQFRSFTKPLGYAGDYQMVNMMLGEATGQSEGTRGDLDLVYCAGLFDYLGNPTCEALLELYLSWVRPGGLVVATNVTPDHSSTGFMTLLLEWNLRLRNADDMLQLAPPGGQSDVFSDDTGMNVFLTIRKDSPTVR